MIVLLVGIGLLAVAVVVLLLLLQRSHTQLMLVRAGIPDLIKEARLHSHSTSRGVVTGLVTEQLVAMLPEFKFNPRDACFLSKPTDYVIFDGLDEGDLKRIVLLEVKTGNSQLNRHEAKVRRCVESGHVMFQTLRLLPRRPGELVEEARGSLAGEALGPETGADSLDGAASA